LIFPPEFRTILGKLTIRADAVPLTVSQLKLPFAPKPTAINFTLEDRQITGLIGTNGAGKSSLLKVLSGELTLNGDSVTLNQYSLYRNPEQYKAQLGYMPDIFPADPQFSVSGFLHWCAVCKQIPSPQIRPKVNHLLEQLQLQQLARRRLNQLSLGQKQRVSLAQALLASPNLLLLDEPLNGLDPSQQEQFWQLLKHNHGNACVLVASHHLADLFHHCQRLLILEQQRLVCDINFQQHRFISVLKQALAPGFSLDELDQLHPKLLAFRDQTVFTEFNRQHSSKLLLSGTLSDTLPQVFRLQATGEWQWH
jgi:ABC-2 type transport system ATP-binding protein